VFSHFPKAFFYSPYTFILNKPKIAYGVKGSNSVLQITCVFKNLKSLFLHQTLLSYHSLESSFQELRNYVKKCVLYACLSGALKLILFVQGIDSLELSNIITLDFRCLFHPHTLSTLTFIEIKPNTIYNQ